jgi:hypothetical protein
MHNRTLFWSKLTTTQNGCFVEECSWYFVLVVPFEKIQTAHAGELTGKSAFADHLVGSLGRGVTWFNTSVGGCAGLIKNLPQFCCYNVSTKNPVNDLTL